MIQLIVFVTKMVVQTMQKIKTSIYGIQKLEFQTMAVPDYFECLREQDLEELVDEEQVFVYDFRIQNMDPENIEKAEYHLQRIYEKKQLNQLD